MANTIRTYYGEIGRTLYPVDFDLGYLDRSHVYVYAGDDYQTQLAYTWRNDSEIELSEAHTTGEPFFIRRVVPRDDIINDYENGAILAESNLDDSFKQAIMIIQEIEDGFLHPTNPIFLTDIDMNGNRIKNLGNAVEESDAMNYGQFLPTKTLAEATAEELAAYEFATNARLDILESRTTIPVLPENSLLLFEKWLENSNTIPSDYNCLTGIEGIRDGVTLRVESTSNCTVINGLF